LASAVQFLLQDLERGGFIPREKDNWKLARECDGRKISYPEAFNKLETAREAIKVFYKVAAF